MSSCVAPSLTRWTSGLPTVIQQVNKFSAIHITQKYFTIYKNIPSMIIPVTNQINPIELLKSYVSKIHFNVILSGSHKQKRRDEATEERIERSRERKDLSKFCFPDCAVR